MLPGHKLRDYNLCQDDEVLLVRELPQRPQCQPPVLALGTEALLGVSGTLGKHGLNAYTGGKSTGAKLAACKGKQLVRKRIAVRPLPPRPTCAPPRLSGTEESLCPGAATLAVNSVGSQKSPAAETSCPGAASAVPPCSQKLATLEPFCPSAAALAGSGACGQKPPTPTMELVSLNTSTATGGNSASTPAGNSTCSPKLLTSVPACRERPGGPDAVPATPLGLCRGDPGNTSASPLPHVRQLSQGASASPATDGSVAAPVPPPAPKEPLPATAQVPVQHWLQGAGPQTLSAGSLRDGSVGEASGQASSVAATCTPSTVPRAVPPPSGPSISRMPATSTSLSWSPPATSGQSLVGSVSTGGQTGQTSPPASARVTAGAAHAAGLALPHGASTSRDPFPATGVACASPPVTRIRRADLQRIGRLGVGAFGVVTLEADRRTGRTYALKAVSKGYLAQLRMEYSVLNEKRILKMVDSPFVVRLMATYNGREHVYFLLEAALGGELFTTYERLRLYGSERHARFYVACVTEALAHLHERSVIYRDLKPENLLLDARGYCKLTDMGLAKVTHSQTYTLVGTPDYMAPEVILCTGHGRSVDWWMLGVLLFELLAGRAPFEADSTQQVYDLVKRGIEAVRFPHEVRRLAADLVRALCRHQPDARLRTPSLREHAFFRGFDWNALRALRLTPPHVPQVRGPRDLANFRSCDGEDPPVTPYQDTGSGWDVGFEDDALGSSAARAAAAGVMMAASCQEAVRQSSGPTSRC